MAYYSLRLVQQKGSASILLRDGTQVNLSPNKKHIFEIENPTMDDIKFYRNYRKLGIVFMAESVNNEVKTPSNDTDADKKGDSTEGKTEVSGETQEQTTVQDTTHQEQTTLVETPKEEVTQDSSLIYNEYMKLTKAQLLEICKNRGIEADDSLSKAEIIDKIIGSN